ncbi:MAG: glycosyltransferase family 4 protein [Candidatus Thorarchaeota archaeon]
MSRELKKPDKNDIKRKSAGRNICLVSSHRITDSVGGVERFTISLCRALQTHGHSVSVVYRTLSIQELVRIAPCRDIHRIEIDSAVRGQSVRNVLLYFGTMIIFSIVAFLRLIRHVTNSKVHIIHAQDPTYSGFPTVLVSQLVGIPAIIHCHGSIPQPHRHKHHSLEWAFERMFYMISLRFASKLIATDSVTARYVVEDGIDPSKVVVIPAYIDVKKYPPKDSSLSGSGSEMYTIGFVGRLVRVKRVDTILHSIPLLKQEGLNVKVILVGDGEERPVLERLISDLNIEADVEITGWRTNILPILHSLDVFVIPSESEGSPISMLEAMSAGVPIVASNLTSIREMMSRDEACFFKVGNPRDLAYVLGDILPNRDRLQKMAELGRERVKRYSLDNVLEQLLEIYSQS